MQREQEIKMERRIFKLGAGAAPAAPCHPLLLQKGRDTANMHAVFGIYAATMPAGVAAFLAVFIFSGAFNLMLGW